MTMNHRTMIMITVMSVGFTIFVMVQYVSMMVIVKVDAVLKSSHKITRDVSHCL